MERLVVAVHPIYVHTMYWFNVFEYVNPDLMAGSHTTLSSCYRQRRGLREKASSSSSVDREAGWFPCSLDHAHCCLAFTSKYLVGKIYTVRVLLYTWYTSTRYVIPYVYLVCTLCIYDMNRIHISTRVDEESKCWTFPSINIKGVHRRREGGGAPAIQILTSDLGSGLHLCWRLQYERGERERFRDL